MIKNLIMNNSQINLSFNFDRHQVPTTKIIKQINPNHLIIIFFFV